MDFKTTGGILYSMYMHIINSLEICKHRNNNIWSFYTYYNTKCLIVIWNIPVIGLRPFVAHASAYSQRFCMCFLCTWKGGFHKIFLLNLKGYKGFLPLECCFVKKYLSLSSLLLFAKMLLFVMFPCIKELISSFYKPFKENTRSTELSSKVLHSFDLNPICHDILPL